MARERIVSFLDNVGSRTGRLNLYTPNADEADMRLQQIAARTRVDH